MIGDSSALLAVILNEEDEPVMIEDPHRAHAACSEYSRGYQQARLNHGDCFAYALSERCGEPLLFEGDGFSGTDIEPALKD